MTGRPLIYLRRLYLRVRLRVSQRKVQPRECPRRLYLQVLRHRSLLPNLNQHQALQKDFRRRPCLLVLQSLHLRVCRLPHHQAQINQTRLHQP